MQAATGAVNPAGGKPGDSEQSGANPCTYLVVYIGIFTVGFLTLFGTLTILCSVPPPGADVLTELFRNRRLPGDPQLPEDEPQDPSSDGHPQDGVGGVGGGGTSDRDDVDLGDGDHPHLDRPFDSRISPPPHDSSGFAPLRLRDDFGGLGKIFSDWDHGGPTGRSFYVDNLPRTDDYFQARDWGMPSRPTMGGLRTGSAPSGADTSSGDDGEADGAYGGLDRTSSRTTHSDVIVMTKGTPPPAMYSQLYYIPKFDVRVLIHGRSTERGGFTPLYEKTPQRVFCVVVAGTDTLGITGAGVNGAMADLLVRQSRGQLTRGGLQQMTAVAHRMAVDRAKQRPGELVELPVPQDLIYERLFAFQDQLFHPLPAVESTVGVAILGVLRPAYYIHGDPRNRYLLYTVAPKGTAPNASFRVAYAGTWKNLMRLVVRVNNKHLSLNLAPIEHLRVPLLSGGIYRGQQEPERLAREAVTELLPMVSRAGDDFMLDFMFDEDQSFFKAIRSVGAD